MHASLLSWIPLIKNFLNFLFPSILLSCNPLLLSLLSPSFPVSLLSYCSPFLLLSFPHPFFPVYLLFSLFCPHSLDLLFLSLDFLYLLIYFTFIYSIYHSPSLPSPFINFPFFLTFFHPTLLLLLYLPFSSLPLSPPFAPPPELFWQRCILSLHITVSLFYSLNNQGGIYQG